MNDILLSAFGGQLSASFDFNLYLRKIKNADCRKRRAAQPTTEVYFSTIVAASLFLSER